MKKKTRTHLFRALPALIIPAALACNAVNMLAERTATPVITATNPATTASLSVAVSRLDNLDKAVVHIETEGTYREPAEGLVVDVEGSGTGFIIDPAGIRQKQTGSPDR